MDSFIVYIKADNTLLKRGLIIQFMNLKIDYLKVKIKSNWINER